MLLKRQLKSGSLKIALVDYVKNTFKILVSFDTFSDILNLFSIHVLVLKNPIFLYMLGYFTELFLFIIDTHNYIYLYITPLNFL